MIKIENVDIQGFEPAIRGMRNPMNSWRLSDSKVDESFKLGNRDETLALKLAKGGPVHAKYRRMIVVWADITAPLYWWKEFDTYKIGTVANSCSTMHKIHSEELTIDDFSVESLGAGKLKAFETVLRFIEVARQQYLKTEDKQYWYQMIQLLPSSYNQKRTVLLNYEVLANIYHSRRGHKLDEWQRFIDWMSCLPHANLFMW